MSPRPAFRARPWAVARAAGLAALGWPALGASSQPHDTAPQARVRAGTADEPRGVTPVGDPETRARFGAKPNVVVVMTDDMRVDDLRYMPTVRRELRDG